MVSSLDIPYHKLPMIESFRIIPTKNDEATYRSRNQFNTHRTAMSKSKGANEFRSFRRKVIRIIKTKPEHMIIRNEQESLDKG